MGYSYQQPSATPPANVKLPKFTADKPLFVEMKAPLAVSGSVWLAFDKSTPNGQFDRILIGQESGRDSRYVGQFIEIGEKLYRPKIAPDGACSGNWMGPVATPSRTVREMVATA